jgi:hypothetical protein
MCSRNSQLFQNQIDLLNHEFLHRIAQTKAPPQSQCPGPKKRQHDSFR